MIMELLKLVSILFSLWTGCDAISSVTYYETLDYSVSRTTRRADGLSVQFIAFNRTFSSELRPSRIGFHPDVKFVYQGRDVNPSTFYHGSLEGDPHSSVKGHVINGLFDGVIQTGQGTKFHIERASKFFDTEQSFHSVIYRSVDVQVPEGAGCGARGPVLDKLKAAQSSARPTTEDFVMFGKDKRQVTINNNKFCPMLIAGDHLYLSNVGGGDVRTAIAELVSVMSEVQSLFQATDFDNDGTADGIVPLIARVEIRDENDPGYRFSSNNIQVNDYLDLWSQENHEQFCLALLMTYRDFDGGVLGLAWVAQSPGGNRGGICENGVTLSNVGLRYLNTAIVTLLNYNRRQPRPVTVITTAHELGHNFGSPHDPSSTECSPGVGQNGNFVMFASATDGQLSNNNRFSPCSRRSILPVLMSKSTCFTSSGTFCGNGVLEEGEECDCGECDNDPCCNTDCTLTPGSSCSPSQSCCNQDCTYRGPAEECRAETECGRSVNCTGFNATCSDPVPLSGTTTLCNNGMNFCVAGVCSGSLCVRQDMVDCQCTAVEAQQCDVCCVNDQGVCTSSFDLFGPTVGQRRESGRSCDNFAGYCDSQDRCVVVDNEDTLNDLLDIFTLDTLNNIVAWLSVFWYIPVAVVVALAILIILLQLTYRRRKPIKRKFSQARNSLRRGVSEAQTGGVGGVAPRNHGNRRQVPRNISPREAQNRLSRFFPNADSSVIQNVIQNTRSESKAVKKLLDRGYPMKRIPIPRA